MDVPSQSEAVPPPGTGSIQARLGDALRRGAERVEAADILDSPAGVLGGFARLAEANDSRLDLLRGRWLGHSAHPMLTDFPLGSWMSASLLDLVGGEEARRPAEKLIAFGLIAAVPTWAAGLAEWSGTRGGPRRAGVVHAAINSTATLLYAGSLVARRRGRHRAGVALGLAGGVTATVGGYFGGHLSFARGIGVD